MVKHHTYLEITSKMPREKPQRHLVTAKSTEKRTKAASPPPAAVPEKVFPIGKLPAELQHMIWGFIFERPACHTFRLVKRQTSTLLGMWDVVVKPENRDRDGSTWKLWKSLHSLKNISFETAFRRYTTDLRPIELEVGKGIVRPAAAMDVATDLIIFELSRTPGEADGFNWYEHADLLALDGVRQKFRSIKRVAIHYRNTGKSCLNLCAFCCTCQAPRVLSCEKFSLCPFEVACFLDCFPDLEEFYVIVEPSKVKKTGEAAFAAKYRSAIASRKNLEFRRTVVKGGRHTPRSYTLARFFDLKSEYLQHLPTSFSPSYMSKSPFLDGKGRQLVEKARDVYTSRILNEPFVNSFEQRQNVKFGLLLRCKNEE